MNDFNKLCKLAEELNPLEYGAIIAEKTLKIMPALEELSGGRRDAAGLFASFLIASVYADGKLDESEYLLMMPMLKLFFGNDFDYASAKAFKPEGKELKKAVNDIVDLLGAVSDELKDDIITVCLLICAIDGKITLKEKNYIKQLIR